MRLQQQVGEAGEAGEGGEAGGRGQGAHIPVGKSGLKEMAGAGQGTE